MDFESLKKIPHSLEAEKALIGGIFYNQELFEEIKDIVSAEDFYKIEHTAIYKAMEQVYSDSKGIDAILIDEEIKKSNSKNKEEILEVLSDILDEITSSYNLLEYANLIKEKAMLRRLGNVGAEITQLAYNDIRPAEDIIDIAESMVLNLSKKILKNSIVDMKTAGVDEIMRMERVSDNRGKTLGISTGFIDLDRMTSGLNNSDLIILAARPAMGKTAFALNLALNAGKEQKNVLVFSLEMPAQQLYQRLLSIESGIPQHKLKNVYLEEDEWTKLTVATLNLSKTSIFVADLPYTNVLEIRSYARKMKSQNQLDLIIIDYLQLINGTGRGGSEFSRQQEISDISRSLKGLARELDVPVIALSQLSRAVESRVDKRPMLSDLRESGAIEQDADIVAFLYREEYYIPETENKGITELIIGKHRNGATGTVKLNFLSEFTKFTNYTDQVK
ncbi:replicative DNA helicase [Fusobacterium hwasookii]|uniref:Replicative DNA helicase n=1 Tax=Fusobacterium hwasookii ChDC F128 TaxID=1216362 RepID=A0ABN0H1L9_9FUSO|nr:replicative DNA helicase [Fusobacterium hwasookii]EJU08206.1 replicative DNA helicase [Fusobacterium hwasookii ChDC F128]QNE65992.1 replicative DNA helicase [Fusobacterium hwasookii]